MTVFKYSATHGLGAEAVCKVYDNLRLSEFKFIAKQIGGMIFETSTRSFSIKLFYNLETTQQFNFNIKPPDSLNWEQQCELSED